jgi:two-component system response regulator (stage 0 sporulation protein F)
MARLLVVDDDPAGLGLRKLVLERHGHEVTGAATVAQALSAFHANPPECVLMDLRLPELEDGLGLIREFRSAEPGVRIVVLSGWTADLDGRPERELVDELLMKPVRAEVVLRAITRT